MNDYFESYLDYNPTGFSEKIFKERYAFTEDESWPDACRRVAKQMALAEHPDKMKVYEDKFYDVLIKNLFVPGGRIWYHSGRNQPQMLNCLGGDTEILTREYGAVKISQLVGQEVTLLDGNGEWIKCPIFCFGEQETFELPFTGFFHTVKIRSTLDHSWVCNNNVHLTRTRAFIEEKSRKSEIASLFPSKEITDKEIYKRGVIHGYIYGDGSKKKPYSEGGNSAYDVPVFSKHEDTEKWFAEFHSCTPPSRKGNPQYYVGVDYSDLSLKELPKPEQFQNLDYLLGFLRGWFLADGCVSTQPEATICGDVKEWEWLKQWAPLVAWQVAGFTPLAEETNYGTRVKKSGNIHFHMASLTTDDFLAKVHHERWKELATRQIKPKPVWRINLSNSSLYKHEDVMASNRKELVYCAIVPTTHSFALSSGIHSGNCFVLSSDLDSKEGWGTLAKEVIITSMCGGGCGVEFSDVRPRGATINSHRGSCPGPIELMKLIDNCAEPIRAGGGRRVALMYSLDLNHPDIDEFLDAKLEKGQLTHANVSVRCRNVSAFIDAIKKDKEIELSWKGQYKRTISARSIWNKIVKNAWKCAEPGFLNWELVQEQSTVSYLYDLVSSNPCQPDFATILTPTGITELKNVSIGDTIWSGKKWTKICNKIATGIKPVYKYLTTAGSFIGTKEHRILEKQVKIEVSKAEGIDINQGPEPIIKEINLQDVMDGWVLGDGTVHAASNNLVNLCIGKDDEDIHKELNKYILKYRPGIAATAWEVCTTIEAKDLSKTYLRSIPERFRFGNATKVCGFLRGLYSANGSLCGGRITLKASSFMVISQAQQMLSSLGIASYYTTNLEHEVEFNNGNYKCKQSYDLNIGRHEDKLRFRRLIGFVHEYKSSKLDSILLNAKSRVKQKATFDIISKEYLGDFLVYDITVEADEHTYWTGGVLASNCGEQPLPSFGCCCLGHLALFRFVKDNDVDWAALSNCIRLAVRFLDNVLSVNAYPLVKMKEQALKERRIGLGTTGLADMLALLNFRYGSPEANKFVDKLYRFISKIAYESSVMLAIEKGPFPLCIPEKHIETGYLKRQTSKIRSLISEHGIRNCAVLTVAPTGTISIITENCSSGIEPMFAPAYERRFWKENKRETELVFHPLFAKFMNEGKDVSHFVGAHDLTVREHMEVQKIIQKHIDSAVSKTINMPEDYPIEDMEKLWLEYLPYLKGTTFYRENSRGYEGENDTQEPPLVALDLKEAIKKYNKNSQIGSEEILDCPKGVCEV